MFLTCEGNRLPIQSALVGEGAAVWSTTEIWGVGDALILKFSKFGDRGVPWFVMMDLLWGAASLDQLVSQRQILRGAALLRIGPQGAPCWSLEMLTEIRIGATEVSERGHFVSVTQFTTSEGRQFSIPFAPVDKFSRGRRIYHQRSSRPGPN
jgi:hypothetical protein